MKRICFRVDANSKIGQGHLMRCLTIANKISTMYDVEIIFAVSDSDSMLLLEKSNFKGIELDCDYTDYSKENAENFKLRLINEKIDTVLIDSYYLTEEYVLSLKRIVNVAAFWCKEEPISADLIINYNIDYNKSFYESLKNNKQVRLLGTDYIPIRDEFLAGFKYSSDGNIKNILVLTGGSDNLNVLNTFIEKASEIPNCFFTCVVGKYSSVDESRETPSNLKLIPQSNNVSKLMKENDLIISAGGTTMYEICSLGIPAIIYSLADNQMGEPEFMDKLGAVCYVGYAGKPDFFEKIKKTVESLDNPDTRKAMSDKQTALVDGKGSERISTAIINLNRV